MNRGETGDGRARRSLRIGLIVVAFWSIPAWLITLLPSAERPDMGLLREFIAYGLPWYFWAAITPFVLRLTRWFPIDQAGRGRNVLVHLCAGVMAGWLEGALSSGAALLMGTRTQPTLASAITELVFWVPFGLLFYGTTAAVGFALDYHRKLREREVMAARVQAQLVEAQLGALRMQLQPHFLFNALNTVSMLVRQGDGATAVRMLARLSDLLRQKLEDGGPQEVPLEDELDLFARYLEIEQVRFGDRLRIRVDVDDAARAALVPTFLLQPLAENAIRHGVSQRAAAAAIELDARREDTQLLLCLRNDGPPLDDGWTIGTGTGIGLRNTAARLRHLYAGRGSVLVSNAVRGGVEVRIEIPYHTQPVPLGERADA